MDIVQELSEILLVTPQEGKDPAQELIKACIAQSRFDLKPLPAKLSGMATFSAVASPPSMLAASCRSSKPIAEEHNLEGLTWLDCNCSAREQGSTSRAGQRSSTCNLPGEKP